MPRMMTTARLATLLLGLPLLLPQFTMAAPLITHRLSTVQADGLTTGSESDSSRAWSPIVEHDEDRGLSAGRDSRPRHGAVTRRPRNHPAHAPVLGHLGDGQSCLECGTGLLLARAWDSRQSRNRGGRERRPAGAGFRCGRRRPERFCSDPRRWSEPGSRMVAQRVFDGPSRVESGRASTVQAPAAAGVSTPAQQPAQPSSDAASASGPATNSTGKSLSAPSAATLSSSPPVPAAPSQTSSTPAAQMPAGPGPGPCRAAAPCRLPPPRRRRRHRDGSGRRLSSHELFDRALRLGGFRAQPDPQPRGDGCSPHLIIIVSSAPRRPVAQPVPWPAA